MSRLRLGVSLQPRWSLDDGTAVLRAAGRAEESGFDHVAVGNRLLDSGFGLDTGRRRGGPRGCFAVQPRWGREIHSSGGTSDLPDTVPGGEMRVGALQELEPSAPGACHMDMIILIWK